MMHPTRAQWNGMPQGVADRMRRRQVYEIAQDWSETPFSRPQRLMHHARTVGKSREEEYCTWGASPELKRPARRYLHMPSRAACFAGPRDVMRAVESENRTANMEGIGVQVAIHISYMPRVRPTCFCPAERPAKLVTAACRQPRTHDDSHNTNEQTPTPTTSTSTNTATPTDNLLLVLCRDDCCGRHSTCKTATAER